MALCVNQYFRPHVTFYQSGLEKLEYFAHFHHHLYQCHEIRVSYWNLHFLPLVLLVAKIYNISVCEFMNWWQDPNYRQMLISVISFFESGIVYHFYWLGAIRDSPFCAPIED